MNVLCRLTASALLPLLLLWGCGPTGGGTGGASLAAFGATAASTCSAPFAGSLSCVATSLTPSSPAQLAGTAPVVFVGESASGPWVLTIGDNRALLQARCGTQRFEGDWGVQANGEGRFYGSWGAPAAGQTQAAQLWVQAVLGRDEGLVAQVQDLSGGVLLGPLMLRAVASVPTEPPACP